MHIAEAQTSKQYNGKQIVCYIKEQAHRDIILKKLDRYIEENTSSLVKEDDNGKDYKKCIGIWLTT
jgi:hypothetical protein